MSARIGNEPLVVVRGDDGEFRAFSNVCRHRGTVIVEGYGQGRMVCPYHHWSYDAQGQLISAPSIGSGAESKLADCRLPEFPCTQWAGFLFVSLSENPLDINDQLEGLQREIGNYHIEEMQMRHVAEETWPVNWKSLLENYMEGYHLTPLHLKTLHKVNPTRLCSHFPPGDHYFGYKVGFKTRVPDDQIGHPNLSEDELNTCVMAAVPPGLTIGVGSDYSSFLCLRPVSPESVHVKMGLMFFGDSWQDEEITRAVELFDETMQEDKAVLLRVRDGLRSKRYEPGPLAPPQYEGTLWDFYQYLSRNLT